MIASLPFPLSFKRVVEEMYDQIKNDIKYEIRDKIWII